MKSTFIKRSMPRSCSRQRGGMLLESIIGMLILSLVGGGIMHSTARMTVAQRDMAVHAVAINQMRNILMSGVTPAGGNACATAPSITLPGESQPQQVVVKDCGTGVMTISGVNIGGAVLGDQPVEAARPIVLELGTGDELVRIGGKVNQRNGG